MVDPTERLSGPYAPMKKRPLEYIQKVINSKIEPSKSILDIDKFKKNPPASFTIPNDWLRGLPELKFTLVNDTNKAFVYAVITNNPVFECFYLIYWRERSFECSSTNAQYNLDMKCRWTDTEIHGRECGNPHIRRVLQELGFNTAETF